MYASTFTTDNVLWPAVGHLVHRNATRWGCGIVRGFPLQPPYFVPGYKKYPSMESRSCRKALFVFKDNSFVFKDNSFVFKDK